MTLSNGKIRILDQLTFALGTKYEVVGLSVCKSRQKLRTEATDTQNDNFSTPLYGHGKRRANLRERRRLD